MKKKIIQEIVCKSYADFRHKFKTKIEKTENYIYRGQYNSEWDIISSFQRFSKKLNLSATLTEKNPFDVLLDDFISHYNRKYKGESKEFDKDAYASIGQHYGLPTTYIDWTVFLDKAIFFAFCDEITNPQNHDSVALFALRVQQLEDLAGTDAMKQHIKEENGIKLLEGHGVCLLEPDVRLPNERIDDQGGVFMKIEGIKNLQFDLIEILKKIYGIYEIKKPILYKFIIPKIEALHVLKSLSNESNIDFASIYPDKDGFAKQAKFRFIQKHSESVNL